MSGLLRGGLPKGYYYDENDKLQRNGVDATLSTLEPLLFIAGAAIVYVGMEWLIRSTPTLMELGMTVFVVLGMIWFVRVLLGKERP